MLDFLFSCPGYSSFSGEGGAPEQTLSSNEFVKYINFVIYIILSLWPMHILASLEVMSIRQRYLTLSAFPGRVYPCEGYRKARLLLITTRAAVGSSRPSSPAHFGIKFLASQVPGVLLSVVAAANPRESTLP